MSYFKYYETRADGTPIEEPRIVEFSNQRALFIRWKWSLRDLQHFIDLACAVPGTPIDVTHWEKGSLVYSARLVYHLTEEESAPQRETRDLFQQCGTPDEGH